MLPPGSGPVSCRGPGLVVRDLGSGGPVGPGVRAGGLEVGAQLIFGDTIFLRFERLANCFLMEMELLAIAESLSRQYTALLSGRMLRVYISRNVQYIPPRTALIGATTAGNRQIRYICRICLRYTLEMYL